MQKFNYNVKTFEDLLKEFPKITAEKYKALLTDKRVKKLIKREITRFEEDEADVIWRKEGVERALKKVEKDRIKEAAKPAACYWYLWAQDHIEDQLLCAFNWRKPENRPVLFGRMHSDGLDEYDREKDSIYEFFQSIEGGGRVKRTINGRTSVVFNPYAKHDNRKLTWEHDAERFDDDDED